MKRHPLDPLSVVLGAAFAVLGAVFLFTDVSWDAWHHEWLWPVGIIALGAVLVALAPRGHASKEVEADDEGSAIS